MRSASAPRSDRIDSVNGVAGLDQRRETYDYLLGITQVAARAMRSWNRASRGRTAAATTPIRTSCSTRARTGGGSSRGSRATTSTSRGRRDAAVAYRYLHDSFGDRSHMVEASWVQSLPARLHVDADAALPARKAPPTSTAIRRFRRASCRASFTRPTRGCRRSARSPPGVRLAKTFAGGVTRRRRRRTCIASVRAGAAGGSGSPGLAEFSARWIEVGLEKRF